MEKYAQRSMSFSGTDKSQRLDVVTNFIIDSKTADWKIILCKYLELIDNLQLEEQPELTHELGILSALGASIRKLPE